LALSNIARFAVGSEGHHGVGQVHRSQQLGDMAGLVVLDIDLDVVQQPPAVLGDTEQVNPGGGPRGKSCRPRPRPLMAAGQRLGLLGHAPGPVTVHAAG
jgi:hypothetical protein